VKQIVGSTLTGDDNDVTTNFESDLSAGAFADMYRKDHLYGGHVIMLGSEGNESPAKEALRGFPKGMHVGGGMNPSNAREYLDAGVSTLYEVNHGLDF